MILQGDASYQSFLESKQRRILDAGRAVDNGEIHPLLFPFQRAVCQWACRKGRAAVFLDTGLGKTFIQLEWSRLLGQRTLILAPLSVARQTVREAKKIGLDVTYMRHQSDCNGQGGIYISNYEMLDALDLSSFGALVLDESSILKSLDGKTRRKLLERAQEIPYRLCCTATPAPNDETELGSHAEFLGVCSHAEMLAEFFVHANIQEEIQLDTGQVARRKFGNAHGQEWRIKNHARQTFFRWLASWAMVMRTPSDLGFSDDGFILPPLLVEPVWVDADIQREDELFFTGLKGIADRAGVRRQTIEARIARAMEVITSDAIHYRTEASLQSSLLYEAPRDRTGAVLRMVSPQQEPDRQGRTEDLSAHLLPRQQEQVSSLQRAAGTLQREQAQEIRGKCRTANTTQETGETVLGGKSRKAQGATTQGVPPHDGRVYITPDAAMLRVCDLRTESQWQPEDISSGGSRPQDGSGARPALPELQSGVRQVQGQSIVAEEGSAISQWVIWCGLDKEQQAIEHALIAYGITMSSVYGSLSAEEKQRRIEEWIDGKTRVLLSKGKICGFGLNLQVAHRMMFLGLSDSWELFYQCIRRVWRYGQQHPVRVFIVLSRAEQEVYANVMRKERTAQQLREELLQSMRRFELDELSASHESVATNGPGEIVRGETWTAIHGDACEELREIPAQSVDLSVYSPPFADLYTYSPSERDLGNSRSWEEFFTHYSFIIREVLRVTKEGRLSCVHVSDIPALAVKDGYIGIKDFPGEVIRAHEKCGWVFVGRAFVQKNPQAQAIRTKSKALLFVQMRKDATHSRPALVDQILIFKKPEQAETPVRPVENGELDNETWISWAHGIWLDIHESDVLHYQAARDADDEKHICPLQLGTIERCIKLYSNPGETVLTPFMGIGSEAYQAVRFGRRAIGIELKESYFKVAVGNLHEADAKYHNGSLFHVASEVPRT